MKAQMKINAKTIVEAEGDTAVEVFEGLAKLAGVLGVADKCGVCDCASIAPSVRSAKGYTYYELVCLEGECGARFSFGQNKEGGGLFPKRKDENGKSKPNGGWEVYQPR